MFVMKRVSRLMISIIHKKYPMKKRAFFILISLLCAAGVVFAARSILKQPPSKNAAEIPSTSETMKIEITLPAPSLKGTMSVEEALNTRRSERSYADNALSLQQVAQLLWAAYGVTMVSSSGRQYKTAPSAGATYPLEIYLMAGKVTDLQPGLYRYLPEKHSLIKEQGGDLRHKVKNACLGQSMLNDAPVSIIFSAVYERTTEKYGKRGEERYVYMDLGHAAQNLYLQATALGLGTCAIGAFDDDQLQKVLQLPADEKVLYLMPVGYVNK